MEIYLIILFFVLIPKIIVNSIILLHNDSIRIKRAIESGSLKWNVPITYFIDDRLDKEEVRKAVGVIQNETCITFQETNDLSGPGLRFTPGRGCGSLIGRDPKNIPQSITIMDNCRFYTYIMHEIGHALGLVHEMKRPDRNNYIIVNKSNIKYGTYDQLYNMYSSSQVITHNLKYDYGSLMHYRYNAFSNGRGHTIIPKDTNYFNTIGQRIELGFNDVKNLNLYYCSDKCKNSLPCKVGGYPDPNNCKICKCPRFYTGTYCQSILKSSSGCGISKLEAKSYIKYVKFDGIKSCYLLITTNSKYKIELTISGIFRSYDCKPHSGLEVKYYSDKSVSGAILCGNITKNMIVSENNVVAMHYVGKESDNYAKISYKRVIRRNV